MARESGLWGALSSLLQLRLTSLHHRPELKSPKPELRDWAGTYVNLITSSPITSLATRRSGGRGASEEWLAATKHDGVEVEPILIDKTKFGQASRQFRSATLISPTC